MGILDNALKIANLVSEVDNASLKKDILELLEECQNLKEENIALRQENSELKEKLGTKESLNFNNSMYWLDGDENPYCPNCYDSKEKLIHLIEDPGYMRYRCNTCKNQYRTNEQRENFSKKVNSEK